MRIENNQGDTSFPHVENPRQDVAKYPRFEMVCAEVSIGLISIVGAIDVGIGLDKTVDGINNVLRSVGY